MSSGKWVVGTCKSEVLSNHRQLTCARFATKLSISTTNYEHQNRKPKTLDIGLKNDTLDRYAKYSRIDVLLWPLFKSISCRNHEEVGIRSRWKIKNMSELFSCMVSFYWISPARYQSGPHLTHLFKMWKPKNDVRKSTTVFLTSHRDRKFIGRPRFMILEAGELRPGPAARVHRNSGILLAAELP